MNNSDNTYNGYTNYETYCLSLWIDNDRDTQKWYNNTAYEYMITQGNTDDTLYDLANTIKDEIEDLANEQIPTNNMFKDLLNSAIENINWKEIASDLIEANLDDYNDYVDNYDESIKEW